MAYRDKNRSGPTTLATLTRPGGVIGKLLAATELPVSEEGTSEPPTPSDSLPSPNDILDMSYEEFAKADLVLRIRSSLLGEEIALASSEEAAARAWAGAIVYLLDEFRHLYASGELNEDALRLLHRLKKAFPGVRMRASEGHGFNSGSEGRR
jgi:hypothetical protein